MPFDIKVTNNSACKVSQQKVIVIKQPGGTRTDIPCGPTTKSFTVDPANHEYLEITVLDTGKNKCPIEITPLVQFTLDYNADNFTRDSKIEHEKNLTRILTPNSKYESPVFTLTIRDVFDPCATGGWAGAGPHNVTIGDPQP